MIVYTVAMPIGTKDKEYEAYVRLLADVGIDLANSPRVPEQGTDRRWLYAWTEKSYADGFAAELRRRTKNPDWFVHEFETDSLESGPVAPLEIATVLEEGGYTYFLTPESRERVVRAYPGIKLPLGWSVSLEEQRELLELQDPQRWAEVSRFLTGRTDEEIDDLGGVRVIVGVDTIAFQRIPQAASAAQS